MDFTFTFVFTLTFAFAFAFASPLYLRYTESERKESREYLRSGKFEPVFFLSFSFRGFRDFKNINRKYGKCRSGNDYVSEDAEEYGAEI